MNGRILEPHPLAPGDPGYPEQALRRLSSDAPRLWVVGPVPLLRLPLVALLCSVRAPGELMLASYQLARGLRDGGVGVVSGFQAPVERGCLDFLLRGRQPVVACPARGLAGFRATREWGQAVEAGRLAVASAAPPARRRPDGALAEQRNRLVAALARRVFVAHATPGGRLHRLAREVHDRGQELLCFDHPSNADLLLLGAYPVEPGAVAL